MECPTAVVECMSCPQEMFTLGLCIINKIRPIMKVLGCYLREVVLHFKVSVFLQMLPATQRDKSRS